MEPYFNTEYELKQTRFDCRKYRWLCHYLGDFHCVPIAE